MKREALIKQIIAIYDHAENYEDSDAYTLRRVDETDDAVMYVGTYDGRFDNTKAVEFAVIVYDETDDVYHLPLMFTNKDWQGPCPIDGKEVKDYDWICMLNREDAIVINDMPALCPWN